MKEHESLVITMDNVTENYDFYLFLATLLPKITLVDPKLLHQAGLCTFKSPVICFRNPIQHFAARLAIDQNRLPYSSFISLSCIAYLAAFMM